MSKTRHPYHGNSMWQGAPPEGFAKAKYLRSNMTEAERVLWNKINRNQLGYKFRRQHPIQYFIVDFYCHQLKIIIEIDGEYHQETEQQEKDILRTQQLEDSGLKLYRFTNDEVIKDIEKVISKIKSLIP